MGLALLLVVKQFDSKSAAYARSVAHPPFLLACNTWLPTPWPAPAPGPQVVFLDTLGPSSVEGWQEQGKAHFKVHRGRCDAVPQRWPA